MTCADRSRGHSDSTRLSKTVSMRHPKKITLITNIFYSLGVVNNNMSPTVPLCLKAIIYSRTIN